MGWAPKSGAGHGARALIAERGVAQEIVTGHTISAAIRLDQIELIFLADGAAAKGHDNPASPVTGWPMSYCFRAARARRALCGEGTQTTRPRINDNG